MKATADRLREIIRDVLPLLREIDEAGASLRPAPEKWSKKEILGHLIDSACNNQQKFVRTMETDGLEFAGYAQNHWVSSQAYIKFDWDGLTDFWYAYNQHIAHIIENADPGALGNRITIEGSGPYTLEFIMKDYLEHLTHHLKQILPDAGIQSSFENIYNA